MGIGSFQQSQLSHTVGLAILVLMATAVAALPLYSR